MYIKAPVVSHSSYSLSSSTGSSSSLARSRHHELTLSPAAARLPQRALLPPSIFPAHFYTRDTCASTWLPRFAQTQCHIGASPSLPSNQMFSALSSFSTCFLREGDLGQTKNLCCSSYPATTPPPLRPPRSSLARSRP